MEELSFRPQSFLGLENRSATLDNCRVVILPVPYEATVTYRPGTKLGPSAIIQASQEVETFDLELKADPSEIGIFTCNFLEVDTRGPEYMIERVRRACREFIEKDKIVALLGGEHSLCLGAVKAYREKYGDLSVLQLDAHGDLRDRYQGSPFNHACVMRRVYEVCPIVPAGVRNLSKEEFDFILERKLQPIYAEQIDDKGDWIEKCLDRLSENVYLTVDMDVFDPSIMPAVGTPEPGGLSWRQVLSLLKGVVAEKNLVGFDVVELSPIPGNQTSDFIAASLIYKIIGYIFQKQRNSSKGRVG